MYMNQIQIKMKTQKALKMEMLLNKNKYILMASKLLTYPS